ncbi:MAG: hypothetical protein WC942_08615 [Clostridia bacterium]|jgi:hypothetical protein
MKVIELKHKLLENGYGLEDLKGKRKAELEELYQALESANNILATAEVTEEVIPIDINADSDDQTKNEHVPTMGDHGWTKYVLDELLEDDEKDNGVPKTDGLRRIARRMFTKLNITTEIAQSPNHSNADRAVVLVTIETNNAVVSGAADSCVANTDQKFEHFPVAVAETRAEGRALRKLLCLKTIVAEEAADDIVPMNVKPIPQAMLITLQSMCKMIGVNLNKLVSYMQYEVETPEALTHQQGLEIAKQINDFKQNREAIPDAVK